MKVDFAVHVRPIYEILRTDRAAEAHGAESQLCLEPQSIVDIFVAIANTVHAEEDGHLRDCHQADHSQDLDEENLQIEVVLYAHSITEEWIALQLLMLLELVFHGLI